MTMVLVALMLAFQGPFWTTSSPNEWSEDQLEQLLTSSPWARIIPGPGRAAQFPGAQAFLASAGPIQAAEAEVARRIELRRPPGDEPPFDEFAAEYRLWLEDNLETQIILAVRISDPGAYYEADELKHLEEDSVMRVGRRKIPMTGYFPPTSSDPFLRMAFPRQVELEDEKIGFELYVPGVPAPFRAVEFRLEPMMVNGKLEL